ncbi:MAG: sugar transferase [Bacteroidota bacterium]
MKRAFDLLASSAALLVLSPVLLIAASGIKASSPGPVLYRAHRMGRGGVPFTMYKLRTMHVAQPGASAITAHGDPRVFRLGKLLRTLKLDELPQLINVLRGEMSVVGPRPEAVGIVEQHFGPLDRKMLEARPGLASPGSIYNYTHGEKLIGVEDPEGDYLQHLMPIKNALDVVYAQRASFWYDLRIIARTCGVIASVAVGRDAFPNPPEMEHARRLVAANRQEHGGSPARVDDRAGA